MPPLCGVRDIFKSSIAPQPNKQSSVSNKKRCLVSVRHRPFLGKPLSIIDPFFSPPPLPQSGLNLKSLPASVTNNVFSLTRTEKIIRKASEINEGGEREPLGLTPSLFSPTANQCRPQGREIPLGSASLITRTLYSVINRPWGFLSCFFKHPPLSAAEMYHWQSKQRSLSQQLKWGKVQDSSIASQLQLHKVGTFHMERSAPWRVIRHYQA